MFSVKTNRSGLLGKAGAFAVTMALALVLSPGQAQAAVQKNVMVWVPSNKYCKVEVFSDGRYHGGKNVCNLGPTHKLNAGWINTGTSVTASTGSSKTTVQVNYVYYGGSFDAGRELDVPNDNLANFWYR